MSVCLFYIPGYLLLLPEIGKTDYSLPNIVLGGFFTLFGLFGHSVLLFDGAYQRLKANKRATTCIKYFFKSLSTLLLLPFGMFILINSLFAVPDHYANKDLTFVSGTLSQKPIFEKGAKSSTSLQIYLREFPELIFEPPYNKYVHNTSFEADCDVGDTLTLGLLHDDYQKKIAKRKPQSYSERHINQNFIDVYHIQSMSRAYYSVEVHDALDADDHQYRFIGWLIGGILIAGCISIWLTELLPLLRRAGLNQLANRIERLREKRIL